MAAAGFGVLALVAQRAALVPAANSVARWASRCWAASARAAFIAGMAVASWAGAGLMVAAAVLCWWTVRRAVPVTP